MTKGLILEEVKDYVRTFEYECLSKEYKNNYLKLKLKCSKEHIYEVSWNNFQQGGRCPKCSYEKSKKTLEEVKAYIEQFGYTCLSKKYKGSPQKLEIRCSKGHIYEVTWNDFQQGRKCPKCPHEKSKKTLEEVKKYIEQFDYNFLSKEYKDNFQKLELQCPKGHVYKACWDVFRRGSRCPECWKLSICGSNSYFWKGGIAAEPYCDIWLDQDYKQSIKDRDGNICLNPYCFRNSKTLIVHHIDYDKKNCHPLNLITLCNSCNGKANFDREWHTSWYQAIIYRRYNI